MKRAIFLTALAGATLFCAGVPAAHAAYEKVAHESPALQMAQTETAEYAARGREIVGELAEKQFDRVYAQFNAQMAAALPADQISQAWEAIVEPAGDFRGIRSVDVEEQGATHVARLTCIFAQAAAEVIVAFDADARVAGLRFTQASDTSAPSWRSPSAKFQNERFQEGQDAAAALDYATRGREVVRELAGRQFDKLYAQFNQKMAVALPQDQIAQTWETVIGQAGEFRRIRGVQVEEHGAIHVAQVTCVFAQSAVNVIVAFDADGRVAGLRFAQASAGEWNTPGYAQEDKFHEVKVTVSDGPWQLPGTLTLPNGDGPFPAVVLVAGSGPEDEDETIGPNRPFKDLAWGLASRGVAVLRYVKRTKQYGAASVTDPKTFTVKDEYIEDARAAVALLAARSDIDGSHIFLAGHSEGGYLAPRIATGDAQIAGIIILDGNTRPIEKLTLEQLHYLANLGGPNGELIEKMIPAVEEQVKTIDSPELTAGTNVKLSTATIPASYFLDLRSYDPVATAAALTIPIYVAQGGRDYQVTATDFAGWEKALVGHGNAKLVVYPALDHLMIPGSGPSSPEDYAKPRHVSGEVIGDLVGWIKGHSRREPAPNPERN